MSHYINGFIAREGPLAAAARTLPNAKVCRLRLGFAFLPFTADLLSLDDPAAGFEAFDRFTEPMAAWAVEQSHDFPIAYIETEYFGGTGGQSAIAWQGGEILFGPVRTGDHTALSEGAINAAVRHIGVELGETMDEYDALGLDQYRDNDDWAEATGEIAG